MEKSIFPLIEKNVGSVTYEHTVVEKLYNDVFIGDAERNYYVDQYHEVNLCVHYNVRKLGTYSFTPGYQYYLTDGRMSLKLHWNMGIPVEDMVIEKYNDLKEAEKSLYYKDFCELKDLIDKEISRQRKLNVKEYKHGGIHMCYRRYPSGDAYYIIMEMPYADGEKCVQVHLDKRTQEWKVSISPCSIISLWNYLKDFDEVNKRELHLMEYISMKDNMLDDNSPYYPYLLKAKETYKQSQKTFYA